MNYNKIILSVVWTSPLSISHWGSCGGLVSLYYLTKLLWNLLPFYSFLFLQMCFKLIAMFHFIEINILSIDNNKILNCLFYLNRYYWTEHFWSFLQSVWLNLQKVCLMMKVAQQNKTTLIKNLRFVSLNKAIKTV